MSTGRIATANSQRYRKGPWIGTRARVETSSYNAPLQPWHWSYDSVIVRRRDARHLTSCPSGGNMWSPEKSDNRFSPPRPPKQTPVYRADHRDTSGQRQPVEDTM